MSRTSALTRLYEAFEAYQPAGLEMPFREDWDNSDFSELDEKAKSSPLSGLTGDDLLDYYYLAVRHVGTSEELRFFLPRILELMVEDPEAPFSPTVLPGLLRAASAATWPAKERTALAEFLEQYVDQRRLTKPFNAALRYLGARDRG